MRSWLVDRWLRMRASYWFIPSIMVILALAAANIMVGIDARVGREWLEEQSWLYLNQPDGARSLLSTLAGSMITVAGVTFSMTLLAVAHASSQIGPQLITRFMRDRANQFTLGTFIATFIYCLMVLRTVHAGLEDGPQAAFVPHLAVLFAVALAVLNVMVLIYFIHHVPQSISVAKVIARVGDELVESIGRLFPKELGEGAGESATRTRLPDDFQQRSKLLRMREDGGFLRVLDSQSLLSCATEQDLLLELHQHPGQFAVKGAPILSVYPASRVDDELESELLKSFSWGSERTREQDTLFVVEQLLEVLGKAMSPGVNGQYTALLCMNQFERAIAEVLRREVPDSLRYDSDGALRVVAEPITHEQFVHAITRPVQQFVRDDGIATRHMFGVIDRVRALPGLEHAAPLLAAEAERFAKSNSEPDC